MRLAVVVITATLLITAGTADAQYMGNMPVNPLLTDGALNNPFNNILNSPTPYNGQSNFHGGVNTSPYDPNSIASPYSRYGSPFSPNSVGNPFGNSYSNPSPVIPFGTGMPVYGATP